MRVRILWQTAQRAAGTDSPCAHHKRSGHNQRGGQGERHETLIAVEKADISFKFMMNNHSIKIIVICMMFIIDIIMIFFNTWKIIYLIS